MDSKATPERIEFENLTAAASDVEEVPSEMDEDEWTDRNFGASAVEGSSDSLSDLRYVSTVLFITKLWSCYSFISMHYI
jgi:hypothetical protein